MRSVMLQINEYDDDDDDDRHKPFAISSLTIQKQTTWYAYK